MAEPTPPDDTTLEGVEQFADESREFAEASLALAAEILPDDTTAPVPADGPVLCLCGNPDNCSCPPTPVTAEDLRERIAKALAPWCRVHEITEAPCERCALRLDAVMAALAGDPGDLPARMAEAMRVALVTWSEGTQHEHLAKAALSVRDELVAHLAARVGDAERRAEHAAGQLSALRDHNARWEREKARADRAARLRDKWLTYPQDDMHYAAGLMLDRHLSGKAFVPGVPSASVPYAEHVGHRVDVITSDGDRTRGQVVRVDHNIHLDVPEGRQQIPLEQVRHVARAEAALDGGK